MGTSSVCFDMLIIDDEENEQHEYLYFDLYFYNGSHTQFIDRLRIRIIDNEEGQLIIISHQMKFQTDTYGIYIHVYKSIDCIMVTVLHHCFNYLDITMICINVVLCCSCLCWVRRDNILCGGE